MVTGETPPQSSIPASTSRWRGSAPGERLGGACTLISGPKTRRAAATVQSRSSRLGSGAPAILVPGFALKFWTMISWMWPWRSWISRIARSDSIRSRRVSPMPMRIPEVNGTRSSPARRSVASRTFGPLVRGPVVDAAALAEPRRSALEHDPGRYRHRTQPAKVVGGEHARIHVREEPGLLEDDPAHGDEIVDGGLVPEAGELLARRPVAELRLVAEGEERLAAAGPFAGLGDGEHFVRGEVGGAQATRGLRERAVVAHVAAKLGEGDEHLRRERGHLGVPLVADRPRGAEQALEVGRIEEIERFLGVGTPGPDPCGKSARLRRRRRAVMRPRSRSRLPHLRRAGRTLCLGLHFAPCRGAIPAIGLRVPHGVPRGVVARSVRDR